MTVGELIRLLQKHPTREAVRFHHPKTGDVEIGEVEERVRYVLTRGQRVKESWVEIRAPKYRS